MPSPVTRQKAVQTIGVISDTHGLLRPEVCDAFRHVDLILHAGDIGTMAVLKTLETLAPVIAVSGNMDRGILAHFLNETELVEIGPLRFFLLHDLGRLAIDVKGKEVHMVISGHTHQPALFDREGVTFLNPGSAGPRRFSLPITVATITLTGHTFRVNRIDL